MDYDVDKISGRNLFSRFSWNDVRRAVNNIDKYDFYYLGDTLCIDFLHKQYNVWLGVGGRGILTNLWNSNSTKFSFVMPKDIQLKVIGLWKIHRQPIPINFKSN